MIINIPEISVIRNEFSHEELYHPLFECAGEVFDNTHIENNVQNTLFSAIIITNDLPQ